MADEIADPASDIDELLAIRRTNDMELDLISTSLSELGESPVNLKIRENLLKLRSLCMLRDSLVSSIREEKEKEITMGAA